MCWNLQLNIVLLSHNLPGYISISKRKEGCKLFRADFFYSHYLIYSRILFFSMYCRHWMIIDLFTCISRKDMQSIYIWQGLCPNYFNLQWFQLSDLWLTLPFTECCFEIYHGPLKGTWKVTLPMPLPPSRVSLLIIGNNGGKNHL